MSFIKVELNGVKCDNCATIYQNDDTGIAFTHEEGDIWEKANQDGWSMSEDRNCSKQYCSKCHHYNEDDEMVIGEMAIGEVELIKQL